MSVPAGRWENKNTQGSLMARRLRQRLLLEELTRQRPSDDYARYLETFRRATVDANPHQIEAVMFALDRLQHGGALLCDEVGLGKTIEAGLVISELRSRGAERILIIVPVALSRQWQVELEDLFSIRSLILEKSNFEQFTGQPGVYIIGREFAGSQARATHLRENGPWDLMVVDESHEILGGLHQRFRKTNGLYQENLKVGAARRAAWLKRLIEGSPILLLTATPLQNNLFELWSLVHFVDQDNTILGPIHEFNTLYVKDKGRSVKEERLEPLRQRLGEVVCRSLRRDVSPFLKVPFVRRTCQTMDFTPPGAQGELYEAVTRFLARPDMVLYQFHSRALTTLQVRRRMGSSPRALHFLLRTMIGRAQELIANPDKRGKRPLNLLQKDLHELQQLARLAFRAMNEQDQKLELLRRVLEQVEQRAKSNGCSDKLVVFTESVKTLETIVAYLEKHGYAGQVTCFSGQNSGPRLEEAVQRWDREVGSTLTQDARPGPEARERAALVHEFRTRTRVLVATEAGAKGLNLQFCSCLVNYDLPWNPQRVEQRIGRVHRYGQKEDVVIFNFINLSNLAENRVYRLLRDKLHLFDGLFGASDEVLGLVAGSLNLASRVDELLRTRPDIGRAFDELEQDIEQLNARCEQTRQSAQAMLEELRPDVQARLKGIGETFAGSLSRFDENIVQLLKLEDPELTLSEGEGLHLRTGGREFRLGAGQDETGENLHLEHPYFLALAQEIVADTEQKHFHMVGPQAGHWEVYKVCFTGVESEEHLLTVGEGDLSRALAHARPEREQEWKPTDQSALQHKLAEKREAVEQRQGARARRRLRLLEGREADLKRFWKAEEADLVQRIEKHRTAQRMARSAAEAAKAQAEVKKLRGQLTTLQNQQRQRLAEFRERLEEERSRLHEAKFVTLDVRPLFAVTITPQETV
jgi:superfamily II DNA or RNA helicase